MTSLAPLTGRLAPYRDRHRGASVLVCGCGTSLALLEDPQRWTTIGVNDIGRRFTPDYLVVVNERRQFAPGRFEHVERTQAKAVFTQIEGLELPQVPVVNFRLGRRGGTARSDGETLDYAGNSPYVAVQLARHMGASRIGLIGVDFTDGHFFGATGRHPLAGQLPMIEREYAALAAACAADGVELLNLSPVSRLAALPRANLADWAAAAAPMPPIAPGEHASRRVFFVHYRFLSCGTVFETGLREAASQAGLAHAHAAWDDAALPAKIAAFGPDLLFVVHGRRFVQRWGRRFARHRSAVWLLDEPYEVDDTATWSDAFDTVFVNDPSTLARHRNARLLPVAYAPALHHGDAAALRPRRAGFVGGANPTREAMLGELAGRGLLDHVVGGPWRDPRLRGLCLAANIPAERAAELYRETAVVLNVFRDRHHFNRDGLPGLAMNPRIVEALACGALVVSEPRPELTRDVPELPTFRTAAEAGALLERFLAEPGERLRVQRACAARLADATYFQRLRTAMTIALDPAPRTLVAVAAMPPSPASRDIADAIVPFDDDWDDLGGVVRRRGPDELVLDPGPRREPGAERGLLGRRPHENAELCFEACLHPGATLVAKLRQAERVDQTSNSYHLLADERRAYLARHHHVFRQLEAPRGAWVRWRLQCLGGVISVWRNDVLVHRVRDAALDAGHAFLGAQGGCVQLRRVTLTSPEHAAPARGAALDEDVHVLRPIACAPPRLSIVTTVYDRVDCLRSCIASVRRLEFRDYEHLIVADHPSPEILEAMHAEVARAGDPRVGLSDLARRHNNWGIAPAAAGLRAARGEFVCFLSDDNGYLPDHVGPLIRALEREPALGFVYSSCQYDGRLVLAHPVPRPGRIDLGQPMFRRELFELHLDDDLPFDMMAWDWHLVDTLMRRGVRWRHIDRPSFIFRLAKYPRLMAA